MNQYFNLLIKEFRPKTFTYITLTILFLFGLFHTTVWFIYTKDILAPEKGVITGDLVRLSCQAGSGNKRRKSNTLARKHTQAEHWKGGTADILTIGDSFSNGGGEGKNRFYQDYIETLYGKKVLNIPPKVVSDNKIELIISLYNNGLLDQIKPKIIILESVERFIIHDFSIPINWEHKVSKEQMQKDMQNNIYKPNAKSTTINSISIINKRNYDCILNHAYYQFLELPLDRNHIVYKAELMRDMFSVNNSKALLFTKADIDMIKNNSKENFIKVNNNLNKLTKLLKNKNITLIFMPVVDKYDLYSSHIKDNKFPKNTFFADFNKLEKEYIYVDTKKILTPLLLKTKDVYYADDSHWNNIASEEIVSNIPIEKILRRNK